MRLIVQANRRLLRDGITSHLRAHRDIEVVHTARTLAEAVECARRLRPDVVVIDVPPDTPVSARAISAMNAIRPAPRLIGVHPGGTVSVGLLDLGLTAVQTDSGGFTSLVRSIREPQSTRTRPRRLSDVAATPPQLTPRQLEILRLLSGGHTARTISAQMAISRRTVEGHKQRIYERLGVENQTQAVIEALRVGLLEPDAAASPAAAS